MLPASILSKAIQLCAAGFGVAGAPHPAFGITVRAGATLARQPSSQTEAEATVRDLLALGADFDAGPVGINGRDFATFGVTPAAVFDACALAHVDPDGERQPIKGAATVSGVVALIRRAFSARITDTIRPMTASYGARYSWHKFGQAIDFVPAAGVNTITREGIRALMDANGVRIVELLGPGDPGHANHWHVAFARPGQVVDQPHPIEGDEDWMVDVARVDGPRAASAEIDASAAAAAAARPAENAPASWDVFAAAEWRTTHGGGS